MDYKLHGLYGHDGTSELNFYSALLIESGFPLSNDCYNNLETLTENQHPAARAYLKGVSEIPFTLKHLSRNVLRKHYHGGRLIHIFVEETHLPQSVKDYIIVKPLLKCVPDKSILYKRYCPSRNYFKSRNIEINYSIITCRNE